MLDKGQNISIGPGSSLHIGLQRPRVPHAQQVEGLDESSPHDLRELIRLQATAISALEKSTRLLEESVALLQTQVLGDQSDPGTSPQREAMHNNGFQSANTIRSSLVTSTGSDLPGNACKNASAVHVCRLENITVGKESQQTIVLEGAGSIRARNVSTGDGSMQFIGRLSDITLQKFAGNWT